MVILICYSYEIINIQGLYSCARFDRNLVESCMWAWLTFSELLFDFNFPFLAVQLIYAWILIINSIDTALQIILLCNNSCKM